MWQVELSNMYRTMEGTHYSDPDTAIEAVKQGKLKVVISHFIISPHIFHHIPHHILQHIHMHMHMHMHICI